MLLISYFGTTRTDSLFERLYAWIGFMYDTDSAAGPRVGNRCLPQGGISYVGQIVLLTQPDTGNRTDSEQRDRSVVEYNVGYQGTSKTPHKGHHKADSD